MFKRLIALICCAVFIALLVWLLVFYMPQIAANYVYQTGYEEEVERYSEEFSVDKALVYSVIKVESNFNPEAVSEIGAIGLMQITKDSFDWTAWKLEREDLEYEDMFTPENSIMFGCYMLSYLYGKYGSIELTAAAYHAGMGTVDGWIESGLVDINNVSVEDIQGSKTSHYVKKILKAYEHYSKE